MQIPIVSCILSFVAIQIDVTCSAAFAAMGMRMILMKVLEMWYRVAVSSTDATTVFQ